MKKDRRMRMLKADTAPGRISAQYESIIPRPDTTR